MRPLTLKCGDAIVVLSKPRNSPVLTISMRQDGKVVSAVLRQSDVVALNIWLADAHMEAGRKDAGEELICAGVSGFDNNPDPPVVGSVVDKVFEADLVAAPELPQLPHEGKIAKFANGNTIAYAGLPDQEAPK